MQRKFSVSQYTSMSTKKVGRKLEWDEGLRLEARFGNKEFLNLQSLANFCSLLFNGSVSGNFFEHALRSFVHL